MACEATPESIAPRPYASGYTALVRSDFFLAPGGILLLILGVGCWRNGFLWLAIPSLAMGGLLLAIVALGRLPARPRGPDPEPARIEGLDATRQHELLRGTSLHLRDMKFRLSIHYDNTGRAAFTREINTITLGFLPVVMLDNLSDKQGEGYVAFPFDGQRWRGPGLPCVGGPDDAIAHAAKCVSPLDEPDEENS